MLQQLLRIIPGFSSLYKDVRPAQTIRLLTHHVWWYGYGDFESFSL